MKVLVDVQSGQTYGDGHVFNNRANCENDIPKIKKPLLISGPGPRPKTQFSSF